MQKQRGQYLSAAVKLDSVSSLRLVVNPVSDNRLVEQNLNLAKSIVAKFKPGNVEDSELYSIACIALMKAAATFDPSVAKFSTWATRIIRQHIITEIRKNRHDTVSLSSLDHDESDRALADSREDFPVHLAGLLVAPDPSDSKSDKENKRMLAMHHLEGQSLSDIGREVGLSKERVRQRLATAIRSIRLKKREEIKEHMSI